jgi:hypothetical protein
MWNNMHPSAAPFSRHLLSLLLLLMTLCFQTFGFSINPSNRRIQERIVRFHQRRSLLATITGINGDKELHSDIVFANLTAAEIDESELLPAAPPITYQKFITMQDKRVLVTIRYSGESGLRPFFLTVAKKLKQSHPDVIVERRILPPVAGAMSNDANMMDGEATFEILVDGTMVVGKTRATRRSKVARVDMSRSRSVYISMQELEVAIARARRRRRPTTTVYGDVSAAQSGAMRKEMLREKGGDEKDD